jgi:hypothetical protein
MTDLITIIVMTWRFAFKARWRLSWRSWRRPWVALPRTCRDLGPRTLLSRGARIACGRNCRLLKTPRDRYRSVLVGEDPSALQAERDDHAGADLGTHLRTNESVDTGRRQVPSEALKLFQGHEGERMRARSRNMILATSAEAPSHHCLRGQTEEGMQCLSQAVVCTGFRERRLLYSLKEKR